jgi:hypothetical protein
MAMGTATSLDDEDGFLCDDALGAIQSQLETLARTPKEYPLECFLGTYEFLFESRDDVEILLENLVDVREERTSGADGSAPEPLFGGRAT